MIITILNLPIDKYYNTGNIQQVLDELKMEYRVNELDTTLSLKNVNELIQYSDLVILPGLEVCKYYGDELFASINSYYISGGTIIYEVDPNVSETQNEFLKEFDMGYNGIRLRIGSKYDVPFAMSDHSFRDRYIYKGIDQVIITQPNHIDYWGKADPILKSNGSFLSIDAKTDIVSNFPNKEITPIAFRDNNNEGLFICINGIININYFNNIEYNINNFKFLCNFYKWISNKKSRYHIAYSTFREIEQILSSIVLSELLRQKGENWKELIPQKILENIMERKPQTKIEEAFDFIHLKKIIQHNWILFHNIFDSNNMEGKRKSLSWMDWVNEKRKYIAHPVKDVNNTGITYDVISKLREINNTLKDSYKRQ